MKKIIYMMLGLMMVWISVPVQAQNVIEDEGIETVDEEDVSDSTLVDSGSGYADAEITLARIGEGGY